MIHRTIGAALLFLATQAGAAVVSHYSFDADCTDTGPALSGGLLVDVATAGNSGITTNAGNWRFGGGALDLAADRDYVSVTPRTFSSGSPYSIAFWARKSPGDTGGAAQWDMVIGQRDTTVFFIALNDGTPANALGMRWRSSSTAANREANFVSPNDTGWHHHVLTADASSNVAYYLDGGLVSVATGKLTGFTYDTIGEAYTSSSDFDFNGQLDEVWVFNETLDATQVTNLYAYNSTSPPAAFLLHYTFDGDTLDVSGSGNHGALSGNAALTADPSLVPVGTGALLCDGAYTSHVNLATAIVFGASSPWTVAFWAWRSETGANRGMVIGERGTTDHFVWLNDLNAGLRFRSSATQTVDFTSPKDTNLHHYALVASGVGTLSLYVDGAFSATKTNGTSFTINAVGQAYSSALPYGFQGVLDDVIVASGALSATDILALYTLRVPPVTSGVKRVRVVLLAGQSNADGRADPSGLPTSPVDLQVPQPDVDFFYRAPGGGATTLTTLRPGTSGTSQFGPEVTLGRHYVDLIQPDASTRVAIVKYARGGTTLSTDWRPGGDGTTTGDGTEYRYFQETVTSGVAALSALYPAATLGFDGLVWMQGESDDSVASTYATNLAAYIADVRATIATNLPFVIGRLSTGQTAIAAGNLATLRAAQNLNAATDPWTGLVDTDTFPVKSSDHLHFDAAGQQALGYGFAFELAYFNWMAERFPAGLIASGASEPDADADGDGVRNADEFRAGSDPTNAASALAASLLPAGGTAFDVRYTGFSGHRYAVDAATNLLSGVWTELLPPLSGTNGPVARGVTNAADAGVYRVRAVMP